MSASAAAACTGATRTDDSLLKNFAHLVAAEDNIVRALELAGATVAAIGSDGAGNRSVQSGSRAFVEALDVSMRARYRKVCWYLALALSFFIIRGSFALPRSQAAHAVISSAVVAVARSKSASAAE